MSGIFSAQLVAKAMSGDPDAQYEVGVMYQDGDGVEQDFAKAREWLEKSATKGNAKAQYCVGAMYANGKGVQQNVAKIVEWMTKSADQGLPVAQTYMGTLYEAGCGFPRDLAKALEWFQKAADQGHQAAIDHVERLQASIKKTSSAPTQAKPTSQPATTAPTAKPSPPKPATTAPVAKPPPAQMSSKVEDWSVNDVITWMTSLNLSQSYNDVIRTNAIDGKVLVTMASKDDWKEVGINTFGDLRKLTSQKPSPPTVTAQTAATSQTQPLQKVGSISTKGVANRAKETDAIDDVVYKKVIDLVNACKPEFSCREHMTKDLPKVLTKVPDFNCIVEECLPIVESCLQRYRPPAGRSPLNKDEALAITAFSFDLGIAETDKNLYHDLNTVMRERKPTKMQLLTPFLTYMMQGIAKLAPIEATVYRGLPISSLQKIEENYRKGTNVHWSGFTSTTSNLKVAQNFAGEGGIIMRIDISTGRSIKPFSAVQTEDEVLLSPNVKLFVHKSPRKESDGYYYLDLTEVIQDASFVF